MACVVIIRVLEIALMSDVKEPFDNEAFNRYMDEIGDDLTSEDLGPDGRFPDGTVYDYDDLLEATVETAPDGRRYVVSYKKGHGLVRVKELVRGPA